MRYTNAHPPQPPTPKSASVTIPPRGFVAATTAPSVATVEVGDGWTMHRSRRSGRMYFYNRANDTYRRSKATRPGAGPTTAVVCDSMPELLAFHMLLSGIGVDHIGCLDGEEIIERIRSGNHYDLILMSERVGGDGGIKATAALRAIGGDTSARTKVIGIASSEVESLRAAWRNAGADDVMEKPFLSDDWHAMLAKHFSSSSTASSSSSSHSGSGSAALRVDAGHPSSSSSVTGLSVSPRQQRSHGRGRGRGGGDGDGDSDGDGGGKQLQLQQQYTADILVVDDQRTIVMILTMMLQRFKVAFETCRSGTEAIERHERGERYRVVLMDRVMPGIDGPETVERLRALGVSSAISAIIGLTGDATKDEIAEFTSCGLDALYLKPFTPRIFREIKRKYLGGGGGGGRSSARSAAGGSPKSGGSTRPSTTSSDEGEWSDHSSTASMSLSGLSGMSGSWVERKRDVRSLRMHTSSQHHHNSSSDVRERRLSGSSSAGGELSPGPSLSAQPMQMHMQAKPKYGRAKLYTATVAIVDDHETMRKLMGMLLKRVGVDFVICRDGGEIVARCSEGERFKIILMDRHMKTIGGDEATRRLRAMGIDSASSVRGRRTGEPERVTIHPAPPPTPPLHAPPPPTHTRIILITPSFCRLDQHDHWTDCG